MWGKMMNYNVNEDPCIDCTETFVCSSCAKILEGEITVIDSDCIVEEMTFSCICTPDKVFEAIGRGG
jgi:hypothetical protein